MLKSLVSEIDAIKIIDETLAKVDNQETRDRILNWAWDKYASPKSNPDVLIEKTIKNNPKIPKKRKGGKKSNHTVSQVKDLNLKPDGKKSFKDFVQNKAPESISEKCAIAVYYLKNEIGLEEVTPNHVFTCFKNVNWRPPSDLYLSLAYTSSEKAWLDTSDMMNIQMTPNGDNTVEFDLPKKQKI